MFWMKDEIRNLELHKNLKTEQCPEGKTECSEFSLHFQTAQFNCLFASGYHIPDLIFKISDTILHMYFR